MSSILERKKSDGTPYFTARVRVKGNKTVTKSFARKTDAKLWAQKTEASILEGRDFPERLRARHTVNDLIQSYRYTILPRRATQSRETYILEWWAAQIGHKLLGQLQPRDIMLCRERLLNEGRDGKPLAASTINKYLIYFGLTCSYGQNELGWLASNPVHAISKPKIKNERDRVLQDDELLKLVQACKGAKNQLLLPFFMIGLHCGCRWSEIQTLAWRNVDFKRKRFVLKDTKNGDSHTIRMTEPVLEVFKELLQQRKLGTPFVFANTEGGALDLRKAWLNALKRSGVQGFRFHDLRHTCATRLAQNGASLLEISQILGHRTMQMVKRYSHLTEEHTAHTLIKMSDSLMHAMAAQGM